MDMDTGYKCYTILIHNMENFKNNGIKHNMNTRNVFIHNKIKLQYDTIWHMDKINLKNQGS